MQRKKRWFTWPNRSREQIEGDVDAEITFHLESRIEELVQRGEQPERAREQARREFGDLEAARSSLREADLLVQRERRRREWFGEVRQDLRFAVRSLRKTPGFTILAALTLALGIGANTTIFTLIQRALLRPLPFADADRIVHVAEKNLNGEPNAVADENFRDWQQRSRSFDALAYHTDYRFGGQSTILGTNSAVRAWVAAASADFFRVFQVQPAKGRLFTAEERVENGRKAVLISDGFWKTQLGFDPNVLGRTIDLYGAQYEIIGVLPAGFTYPGDTDVWLSAESTGLIHNRTAHNWTAVGRLKAGVTAATAQQEMDRIGAQLAAEFGPQETSGAAGALVRPLQDVLYGSLRKPLMLLLGAAALVLLIACVNIASALLARGAAREREIAVRVSLGARRGRLVRQLLTEDAVLAGIGAVLGIGVAFFALRGFLAFAPGSLARVAERRLDPVSILFAGTLACITTLLFGLLPALRIADTRTFATLRSASRGNAEGTRQGIWNALVMGQVALAVVLLISAALLIRSMREMLATDVGFEPDRLLTVDVSLPDSRYATDEQIASFYERALAEVQRIPGVLGAGMIQHVPFSGRAWNSFAEVEGRSPDEDGAFLFYRVASPDYFRTMGIRLSEGRVLTAQDRIGSPTVAVVNRAFVQKSFGGRSPIGVRVRNIGNEPLEYQDDWITIVGVVNDVRPAAVGSPPVPELYVSVLQHPERARNATITVRTSGEPAALVNTVRARLHGVDADVPLEFATMSDRIIRSVSDTRFTMYVLTALGALALMLSAVGIYGVVSYAVARRTREVGIRLALGATPASVLALVQKHTMQHVALGAFAGLLGALAAGRLLRTMLYEIEPLDPISIAAAVILLSGVAWLASYVPARRTTRVDPMLVMRAE